MNKSIGVKFRKTVSTVMIVFFFTAAVLMTILSLVARAQLTAQLGEAKKLANELSVLESEKRKLLIDIESRVDLAEVEEKAKNSLGMQTPNPWQKQSICTGTESIFTRERQSKDISDERISSFTEYFGLA